MAYTSNTPATPDDCRLLAIGLGEVDDGSHWHQVKLKARAVGISNGEILRLTEAELIDLVGDVDSYADWVARILSKSP